MRNKPDIGMANMLKAMLEGDEQGLLFKIPTCPKDGSLWTVGYAGCIENSATILPLIVRYKFEDVCKAVFCINSWYQNRPAQCFAFSANAALISAKNFGENPITTYEDFKAFFKEIESLDLVSPYEDYVIPVMGHTKLYFKDRWWPAFYGCGMIHEYSRLCFADSICLEAGRADEFELLLDYTTSMIDVLDGGGWDGEEIVDIALDLPPESHWNNTIRWFEKSHYVQLPSAVTEVLSNRDKPIESIHFIKQGDVTYPLFNPSILTDYLGYCCELLQADTLTGAIDTYLALNADLIYTSNILDKTGLFLWPRFKIADDYFEDCPVAFMLFDDSGCLTVFYDSYFGDGNLRELRRALVKRSSEVQAFESYKRERGYRGLGFKGRSVKTINLVAFVNDVAPVTIPSRIEISPVAVATCGALDLLSIFHAASSVEEINAYFTSLRKTKIELFSGMSGVFPHFWSWKNSDRNILAGAEDNKDHIVVFGDYNDNDLYYCEFFRGDARHYPSIDSTYPFGSPFLYRFEKNDQGFVVVTTKAEGRYVSEAKRLGDKPRFLQLCADSGTGVNFSSEELEREIEANNLSQDILTKLVNSLEDEFGALAQAFHGIVRFEYVCEASVKAECLDLIDEELGIHAKILDAPFAYVCYTFDKKRFIDTLVNATDRSIECRLGKAIVSALKGDLLVINNLIKAIDALRYEKKLSDMRAVEVPYIWHRSIEHIEETDVSRKAAIKTVAIAADKAEVKPGVYEGADANELLRRFQGGLTSTLKEELGKYEAETLIKELYEICGNSSHDFFVHTNRFGAFTKIDEQEAYRLKDSTLDLRENARELMRASRYCIEAVLAFDLDGEENPSTNELAYLLSLASQCLGTSDIADMLRFNPRGISVEIEDNKTVRVLEDDVLASRSRDVKKRSLVDPGHILEDATIDISYVGRSKVAFEKDTGVSFDCFLCVLDELALGVESNAAFSFVRSNVVSVSKEDLITYLSETLHQHFQEPSIRECIEFLTIDDSTLNTSNGMIVDYIPFGRIKDRPNRLELKPLISFGDMFVYSPVCTGLLKLRWMDGIAQRFLPTKAYVSLDEVCKQWKRHYEKALEKDVRECFLSHGFNSQHVFKTLHLHKHGNHPQHLGDYDGLAFDEKDETIWCIECKEFEKVESAFDSFQLQQRWFGKNGKLRKFEKRVRYLNDHLIEIARDLGFRHSGALKVKPYLVSNKLFLNMIGESNFEIITLNELNKILDKRQS